MRKYFKRFYCRTIIRVLASRHQEFKWLQIKLNYHHAHIQILQILIRFYNSPRLPDLAQNWTRNDPTKKHVEGL